MAAVDADEAIALDTEIRRARAAILTAVTVGNLTGDPVSKALEAMSLTLAAQLALHKASTGHLEAVSDRLNRQVEDALSVADGQLRAKQTDLMNTLAPRLAVIADDIARARLSTIRSRAIALCAATVGIVIVVVGGGAYGLGYQEGRQRTVANASAISTAIERDSPGADQIWASLIADNDLAAAMTECRKTVVMEGTRHACSLPVWLDPPDASPPSGGS